MTLSYKNSIIALLFVCANLSAHLTDTLYTREFGIAPDCSVNVQTKPELRRPNIKVSPAPSVREGSIGRGINPWHHHNQLMNEIAGPHQVMRPTLTHEACKQYCFWQMHGDVKQLKRHRHMLKHKLRRVWFWQKADIQLHIDFINDLLNAPLTKALDTIKNGGLADAASALKKLEVKFGCAEGMFQIGQRAYDEAAHARMVNGFDCIDAARTLFENRADYPEFLEHKRKQQEEATMRLHPVKITTQNYHVEESAAQLLERQGLDPVTFKSCDGNAIQQAIHEQFVTIVNRAAELQYAHAGNDSVQLCTHTAVELADVGREYNKRGLKQEAICVADFCWALIYYTKEIAIGACEGVPLGIRHTAEMILHPIDTVYSIFSMIHQIIGLLAELEELAILHELDTNLALKKHQDIREKYRPIHDAIKKEAAKMTVRDWSRATVNIITQVLLQKKIPSAAGASIKAGEKKLHLVGQKISDAARRKPLELVTVDGQVLRVPSRRGIGGPRLNSASPKTPNTPKTTINQSSLAILKDGYYEVNGFKFSEYYYNRLWSKGRPAPTFTASAILENAKAAIPDRAKQGFFRYEFDGWEMIYNPSTKEVWHLSPIKLTKAIK